MKVRLKLGNVLLHADALPVFQFHEGPIKTKYLQNVSPFLLCFNSMKVRLKQRYFEVEKADESSFNSMKVRLKRIRFYGSRVVKLVSIP